jgi:hypothetical protein
VARHLCWQHPRISGECQALGPAAGISKATTSTRYASAAVMGSPCGKKKGQVRFCRSPPPCVGGLADAAPIPDPNSRPFGAATACRRGARHARPLAAAPLTRRASRFGSRILASLRAQPAATHLAKGLPSHGFDATNSTSASFRTRHQIGTQGIALHVTANREKVAIRLHRKGLKPALVDRPFTFRVMVGMPAKTNLTNLTPFLLQIAQRLAAQET